MEYIPAKTIVTRNKSTSWFGTEYNMNIYRGCCHGCIYCDSRSDCYRIDHFDTVRAKENALKIIRSDLQRKIRSGVIGTGSMSDPYNPFEKELLLTRHALELVGAFGFGIAIATKSDLVTRDIDILKEIQEQSPVLIKITITAAEDSLSAKVEPHAPPSSKRFAAVRSLADAGIFCGLLMMPVLPFIEDNRENILSIVSQAAENGARFIYPAFGMTTRPGQREFYYAKLDELFPGEGIRQKHGRRYGASYECASPRAKELFHLFSGACQQHGLLYQMKDIISAYKQGYENSQLSFFD